jgi:hypothetical protein
VKNVDEFGAVHRALGGRDALRDALPLDPRQDVRWLTSGAAPLIVYAFRRVRRSTWTDAFHTCNAGRAGMHLSSEAIHESWPSDVLPRIKRERVPTFTVARERISVPARRQQPRQQAIVRVTRRLRPAESLLTNWNRYVSFASSCSTWRYRYLHYFQIIRHFF